MISIAEDKPVAGAMEEGGAADPSEWIARLCAAGDPAGFSALYDRWEGPMRNVAANMLGSWDDAEDAVQETILKVARSIRSFDFRSRFSTWLFRIHVNTCRDHMRRRARRIEESSLEPALYRLGEESSEPLMRMTLRRLIANLAEKERLVFVLYEIEGFSHAEIAEVLDRSESYSKWLLFTTKQKLRAALRSEGEQE